MIDFHSHILPGIDDGSQDLETSLLILEEEKKQGIDKIILTPHFYPGRTNLNEFHEKKKRAYEQLMTTSESKSFPTLVFGSEVALTYDVPKLENLESLCIEGTNLILIELPYQTYNEWVLNSLFEISARGLTPVIAHFERFISFDFFKALYEKILDMNYNIQINATFAFSRQETKFLKNLLKKGVVPVLGSDVHNTDSRFVHLLEAREKIKKKFGDKILTEIDQKPYSLLEEHSI